jgi:hypothetical protein
MTLIAILAAAPVLAAQHSPGSNSGGNYGSGPGFGFPFFGRQPRNGGGGGGGTSSNIVTIRGTITALSAATANPQTLQVTDQNGLAITLKLAAATVITRDGAAANFAALKVGDGVQATYDRTTQVASRLVATSPPPVTLTGTLTALNVTPVAPALPTLEVTTDHGTAIQLTANGSTRVTLNGRLTTLASLALGDGIRVTYRTTDKLALTADGTTPALNVISGAITALTLTGNTGSLSLTPLVGAVKVIPLVAATRYLLNGRAVAPGTILVGYLATVQLNNDGSAAVVSASTPPLVDLQGSISALTASTIEVTTPSQTKITLRLTSSTVATRNGAAVTTTNVLKVGDSLVVRYEYRLIPGQSNALIITATGP